MAKAKRSRSRRPSPFKRFMQGIDTWLWNNWKQFSWSVVGLLAAVIIGSIWYEDLLAFIFFFLFFVFGLFGRRILKNVKSVYAAWVWTVVIGLVAPWILAYIMIILLDI